MNCPRCAAVVSDTATFCPHCGASCGVQTQETVPPQPQPPVYNPPPAYNQPPAWQPPAYQQPYPQQPYAPSFTQPTVPGKGMGIAAMVLGIVGLVLLCEAFVSLPCAILSLILGIVSLVKAKKAGMKNGMAVTGIVLGSIAIGLYLLFVVLAVAAAGEFVTMETYYYS